MTGATADSSDDRRFTYSLAITPSEETRRSLGNEYSTTWSPARSTLGSVAKLATVVPPNFSLVEKAVSVSLLSSRLDGWATRRGDKENLLIGS